MLNKWGERTLPCLTPLLTWNHSDSLPATFTLAHCFLYSFTSKSIRCSGYPMSILVTQSLQSRENHSNAFLKSMKHICTVAVDVPSASEFWDLLSGLSSGHPSTLPETHLFIGNLTLCFNTYCFQDDLQKHFASMSNTCNCAIVCTLLQITFLRKCDECGKCPFFWPFSSLLDRHTQLIYPVKCQFCNLCNCHQSNRRGCETIQ